MQAKKAYQAFPGVAGYNISVDYNMIIFIVIIY